MDLGNSEWGNSEWRIQANWSRPKHMNFLFYWRVSEASETLTGVTQLKIRDVCLLASEWSETVLGMDREYVIGERA